MPVRQFDGQHLRRARRARELSQEALGRAEGVGVEQPTVAKWETGATFPEPERLPAIARALGESLDSLFPRLGEPDLADLRCDAGYPQKRTGELIGARSHIPVSNAERGVRRLNAAYVPLLAAAYKVGEKELLAAQDRSFGIVVEPTVPALPVPRTLAEKLTYLLETTFPHEQPTDAQIAVAVNGHAGVEVISAGTVEALRTGTPPATEVLSGLAAGVVLEGLAEFFGVTQLYFQSDEELERQVVDAISLLALRNTDGFGLAARGAEAGLDPAMLAKISALVAEAQQKAGPH
ncbi:helix-turn-helix transcriptional regulator [Kitasatospora sp. LaBMicrA B282]|uniref:helix-turn-helix transcriptional regulator n=1 Tax=Kitasatospora sp. LaBMicrA B282 TaxID=3420949 RepID=UPI003D131F41